jgi:hypothetical protein
VSERAASPNARCGPRRPLVRRTVIAALPLLLASCASVSQHLGHYTGGVRGLASADGWTELPVGRWLLNDGIRVEAVSICPRDVCAQPGFAARIALSGGESAMISRIRERPETLVTQRLERGARAPAARRRGQTEMSPLTLGDWSGGLFTLRPATSGGHAAHVAVLARAGDSTALIVAAPEQDAALALARAATWW